MAQEMNWEKWSATSGYAALAFGVAAVALERPWPSASEPAALPAFLADHRGAIVAQSVLFLLSAALMLGFLAVLRGFLLRAEGGTGRLTALAFGAGVIAYGLDIVGQAPQITLVLPSQAAIRPDVAAVITDLGFVMLTVANLPLAVMFAAVGVLSLRTDALPAWLGWLSAAAAAAALTLTFTVVDPSGPLATQGWAVYLLYLVPVVWLASATTVMVTHAPRRAAGALADAAAGHSARRG
jgi:hypothetical protein